MNHIPQPPRQELQSTFSNPTETFKVSTYSALTDALNLSIHGNLEYASISIQPSRVDEVLTVFDPQHHYSTYSTLSRALEGTSER